MAMTTSLPPNWKLGFLKKLDGYNNMTVKAILKYSIDYAWCFHLFLLLPPPEVPSLSPVLPPPYEVPPPCAVLPRAPRCTRPVPLVQFPLLIQLPSPCNLPFP